MRSAALKPRFLGRAGQEGWGRSPKGAGLCTGAERKCEDLVLLSTVCRMKPAEAAEHK